MGITESYKGFLNQFEGGRCFVGLREEVTTYVDVEIVGSFQLW